MAYFGAPFCGGLQAPSGKGAGPDLGLGQRCQTIMVWPSWGGKTGSDIYLSSRWDDRYQIYDLYWTPKDPKNWWTSKTYDWVFIQEIPLDLRLKTFVWTEAVPITLKSLKKQRRRQLLREIWGRRRPR